MTSHRVPGQILTTANIPYLANSQMLEIACFLLGGPGSGALGRFIGV